MSHTKIVVLFTICLTIALLGEHAVSGDTSRPLLSRNEPTIAPASPQSDNRSDRSAETVGKSAGPKIEGSVIRAYRQAVIAAEVQGVVRKRYGKEGDYVLADTVIFEIRPDLFRKIARRAKERLAEREITRRQAEEELKLKEQLLAHDAATLQEILRARSDAEIALHRSKEAKLDLELAVRDVEKCTVKAPFAGYLMAFYRDVHETVQRFDQLFLIGDTSKVYAVVSLPESLSRSVRKGTKAWFTGPSGAEFRGAVEKVEAAIDPSSQTRKVYVLIDNAHGRLQMGMLGKVTFAPGQR